MVKTTKAQKKKGKASASKRKVRMRNMARGVLSDPRVAAWDALLRDPCAAQLAAPCYSGSDTGYLVRTVDSYSLTAGAATGTVGANTTADGIFQFTPFNVSSSTGVLYAAIGASGALPGFSALGPTNFLTGSTVKRYRPVACCLKYIPTGPYSNRQGMIGLAYSSGMLYAAGDSSLTIAGALSECQRLCFTGSEPHEVRWLPTAVDENFTDLATSNNSAAGTLLLAFKGVDAVYNTTTTVVINGSVEVYTVWEWVPHRFTGVSMAPKAPLPYTTQSVLATIGDMGAYLFDGIRAAGTGVVKAAMREGVRYLTGGVVSARDRGPGLLTYH